MTSETGSGSCAIDVRDLCKQFGTGDTAFKALGGVSVSIRQNEFFTLLGPSGCGKTTLLRMIAGFDFPDSGDISLYGSDIVALPPFRRPVNTVFQNYALFPHMTVAENIGFGLEMLGRRKAEISARVEEMLRLIRLEHLATRRVAQMSGGQQQRVALARALAPQPKVLLLDEPLSALDYKLRKEMQTELKRLQLETGITFIFVTHDQEEALTMSDRIAVMSAGRILQIGTPREIYNHPADRFVASFIGETNFLAGTVDSMSGRQASVTLKAGATLRASAGDHGVQAAGPVTVVIRPEHAKVVRNGQGLAGVVDTIDYFGTDTHIRLRLDSGETFMTRHQNAPDAVAGFEPGERVHVAVAEGAAQIVRD